MGDMQRAWGPSEATTGSHDPEATIRTVVPYRLGTACVQARSYCDVLRSKGPTSHWVLNCSASAPRAPPYAFQASLGVARP